MFERLSPDPTRVKHLLGAPFTGSLWALRYKTFLSVIYELSEKAKVFVLGKHCQPSLMFVGKARSLSWSGASERCLIRTGALALPTIIRLG
jgi:hypothetical protein